MGHDLTRRYSAVFATGRLDAPLRFVRDVYAFSKLRELSSFVVWEAKHRLRLFPKRRYLTFSDEHPIALDRIQVDDSTAFEDRLNQSLLPHDLRATQCQPGWKVLFIHRNGALFGSLGEEPSSLYTTADGESLTILGRFPGPIKSVFVTGRGTILVCIKGAVFRSTDDGTSFDRVLTLGSSESFWRHNNAVTEIWDGTLLVGEYGNVRQGSGWKQLAYLYSSADDGATWTTTDFLIRQGTNKHVHIVHYSRLLNRVFVADGDNYKKLWMSGLWNGPDAWDQTLTPVNRFHIQMGGHTAVAESGGKLFFGTDYQGGTNFVLESTDGQTFTKRVVPDPYRRSPIDNMAVRTTARGREVWANLPYSTAGTKGLLMYTADNGESWRRLIEYSRSSHTVWLISSSAGAADAIYVSVENPKTQTRMVYKIADR